MNLQINTFRDRKSAVWRSLLLLLLFMFLPLNPLYAVEQNIIKIGGTGGALGGMKKVGKAFQKRHPGIVIIIPPSLGSSGGIKAVLSGAIDIAVTSRPPNDDERKQGAVGSEYARTPFIFVTSRKDESADITLKQLVSIYAGEKKTWSDGTPLRLILRPAGDTDITYLREISPGMNRAVKTALSREGMTTAVTDQENLDAIERIRGGFGASTLSQVITEHRSVNILRLNGVLPGIATMIDGSYPYYKCLFVVTGSHPSPEAKLFIDFLNSQEGRAILNRTGHQAGRVTPCRVQACVRQ